MTRFWSIELYDLEASDKPAKPAPAPKEPRKRRVWDDEREMMAELERAQLAPLSIDAAEKALGCDIHHYNEPD